MIPQSYTPLTEHEMQSNAFHANRQTLQLTAHGYSIQGTRHSVNQDRYWASEQRGLFIVADGMGGCRAGERASHMAVERLAYHPSLIGIETTDTSAIQRSLERAFIDVSKEIHAVANVDSQLYGMGTTAVLAMEAGNRLYIASLGDSRAYLYRDGELRQLTVDHNMAQTLLQVGAISKADVHDHQWRHMLWKYLGAANPKDGPDVTDFHLRMGDRVLLLTDGVTETLRDQDLAMIVSRHPTAAHASEALTRSAVAHGTRDDATSLVIDVAAFDSQ